MPEFKQIYVRQRKNILLLMSLYAIGWGVTPYKPVFLGLILGTAFSLINLWLLVRRTEHFDQAVKKGKKVRSFGMLSRMAVAVIAVMIAMEYPQNIHIISVVLGLMTSYIVIMIDYFLQTLRLHK
ncbi:ATP synthase subunit I [Bacillus sp. 03113]|uniref:ATP synthase subunit I n=1 Tax=Bacillus sp. 03113 TaxID=2578211 RepID=UPI001141A8B2|nr:ATP synthase subunit I [Bacillus sp. 03113]